MRNDLSVHGVQGTLRVRQAAATTRVEAGEPMGATISLTTGTADVNVFALVATDVFPTIGTNVLGGIAHKGSEPFGTGTVVANEISLARPVPQVGVLRGAATTRTNIDTEAELLAILHDVTFIDYNATGGTDGGELYTIIDTDSGSNAAGLEIVDGNIAKGTLDCNVDARAYRNEVS